MSSALLPNPFFSVESPLNFSSLGTIKAKLLSSLQSWGGLHTVHPPLHSSYPGGIAALFLVVPLALLSDSP